MNANSKKKKPFAVFDIDGTLIRWQLYHVVVDRLATEGALRPDAKQLLRDARMTWKRREHEQAFKAYEQLLIELYEEALGNLHTATFDRIVTEVIDEYKDQTYVYTRELLGELKRAGYLLLIISGSHHELIEQIGTYYGFDDWIGTHYERTGDTFSGEKWIASHDKAASLNKFTAKYGLSFGGSLAIGDSASDISMLELVERPIAFNPDKILYEKARKEKWEIVVERKNMVYELRPHDGTYVLD